MDHHATLSPSALPMLDKCQLFERGAGSDEFRDDGNRMHKAFANLLMGKDSGVVLTMAEGEAIQWAVDYVRVTATNTDPIEVETKLSLTDDSFRVVTFGTADVLNGRQPWIGDLKTMDEHDYWMQMAAYALMKMQRDGGDYIEVDVMYSRWKRVVRYVIGRREALERLQVLFAKIRNPHKEPQPNEFCKWCTKLTTCEAVNHRALAVAQEHGWQPATLQSDKIIHPADMAKALAMARLMSDWSEEVERRALAMSDAGIEVPGYRRKPRAGKRVITDAIKAFELSGLPVDAFQAALTANVGAVEEAIAKAEGLTLKAAKAETNRRLADVIDQRPPTTSLVPIS